MSVATKGLIALALFVAACRPEAETTDADRAERQSRAGVFTVEYRVDPATSTADVILPDRLGGAKTTVTLDGTIRMEFDTTAGARTGRYTFLDLNAPSRMLIARWQNREERVETGDVHITLARGDSLVGTIDPATRTYHLAGQITLETPALAKYGVNTIPLRTNVSGVVTDTMVYEKGASVSPLGIASGLIALASRSGSKGGTGTTPTPAPLVACGVSINPSAMTQAQVDRTETYGATGTPTGGTYRWSVTPGTGSADILTGGGRSETAVKMRTAGTVTLTITYTCPDPPGGTATASITITIR